MAKIINISDMTKNELTLAARKYNAINNEGGEGYNPYEDELDRRYREEAKARAESFESEWTKDVTDQRKAAWNDAVRANMPVGKLTAAQMQSLIAKCEDIVGFRYASLQQAIRDNK